MKVEYCIDNPAIYNHPMLIKWPRLNQERGLKRKTVHSIWQPQKENTPVLFVGF